jgi:general secretion pathway protein K
MSNERGIALIITLLVVTLLTITVVDFTYSVMVDQQLTHNALAAMQAQMLARSGINYGEALLARDTNNPPADWYYEDWANPDVESVIQLDPGERLAVRVIDEGGKININRTRPRPGAPPPVPGQPNLSPDAFLRDALRRLFEANGVDVQIPDRLLDYWMQAPTPEPGQQPQPVEDFRSLEEFGATFGIPALKLRKLSRSLTAIPVGLINGQFTGDTGRINVNTAPPEVLAAILNDQGRVDAITQNQNAEQPIEPGVLNQALQGMENQGQIAQLFGYTSAFFRIYASALVNADPTGKDSGGVGQTVVALVNRRPMPGVPPNAPPGTPRWTLTPLDWQKRGGAELLTRQAQADQEAKTPGNDF